jgi:phospholipase C
VFRARGDVPYDHTSVIATVLQLLGVDREHWRLGARVAHAPPFDDVLGDVLRAEVPGVEPIG